MNTKAQVLTFLSLLIFSLAQVTAQTANRGQLATKGIFDVLSHSEIIDLTLEADIEDIITNRRTDDYQPATLSYKDSEGKEQVSKIKIKPRGKFRRRVCDFPPLKLNFSKKDLRAAGLNEFDGLKLVTHCLDSKSESREAVMREYLAYKMYNLLSEESYRVQLVRITYEDSESKMKIRKRYGFLIEDTDAVAARLDGEECNCMNPAPETLVKKSEQLVAMFQYMIGNADWDLTVLRNVKVIDSGLYGKRVLVPFDFDFSGFVNAPYAIPNPDLKLTDVKQRAYRGIPYTSAELQPIMNLFLHKKQEIKDLVMNFELLPRSSRDELMEYINEFYSIIETNDKNLKWTTGDVLPNGDYHAAETLTK